MVGLVNTEWWHYLRMKKKIYKINSQTITDTGPASQVYFAGDVKPDKPAIACVTAAHPRKKTSERCVWGYCCNLRSGVPCIFCRGGPSRHDKNISDA